jgi:hypothetical protein
MVQINFEKMKEQVMKEFEGKEVWVGVLTIFLERKELCIAWAKEIEDLRRGEDRCFDISVSDDETEYEIETMLRDAIIQNVKLDGDTIKIYLIAAF